MKNRAVVSYILAAMTGICFINGLVFLTDERGE